MASSTNSQYFLTATNMSGGLLSIANPNLDGTGATVVVFSTVAPTLASRISQIHMQALGATTAGMIRLFVKKASGAVFLIAEVPVLAVTPSSSVKAWAEDYFPSVPTFQAPSPLELKTGDQLLASTANGENFAVTVFGADF